MKIKNQKYLDIVVPKGGSFPIKTRDDFIQLPGIILAVAKRGVGKTCAFSNLLRMCVTNQALDRLIIVSPTYHNNAHYFEGLPFDEKVDLIEPTKGTPEILIDILNQMGEEYDEYHALLAKWNELQKEIRSDMHINDIDEFLLLNNFEKPTYKYMRNGLAYKPSVFIMFDDCQGGALFSASSKLSNMVIKHRHLGQTIHKSIGCSMLFACQNYTSNSCGLPKSVRANITHMMVFKNKSIDDLTLIASEVSGEVTPEQFFEVYDRAILEPHDFLFIDLHRKKTHPSMFRRNMNEFIEVKSIDGGE